MEDDKPPAYSASVASVPEPEEGVSTPTSTSSPSTTSNNSALARARAASSAGRRLLGGAMGSGSKTPREEMMALKLSDSIAEEKTSPAAGKNGESQALFRSDSSGFSSGSVVDSDKSVSDITDLLTREVNGLGSAAVLSDKMFQFTCVKKKCGKECAISGQAMREAAAAVMATKKWKKKGGPVFVEVACSYCGHRHNLQAEDGDLS